MASLDIPSLDIASLDIASLDIGSFFIASLDIASLDMASCAYAAEPALTRQAVSRAVASLFMDISQNGLRFKWQRCRISGAAERSAHTESVAATRSGFVRAGCSHERRHSDAQNLSSLLQPIRCEPIARLRRKSGTFAIKTSVHFGRYP